MEELRPRPRRSSGPRGDKRKVQSDDTWFLRPAESEDFGKEGDQEPGLLSPQRILYYTLLVLKVALWIFLAWVLSHLHLGAPCFLLSLTFWLYSGPMQVALKWAKRRLRGQAT